MLGFLALKLIRSTFDNLRKRAAPEHYEYRGFRSQPSCYLHQIVCIGVAAFVLGMWLHGAEAMC